MGRIALITGGSSGIGLATAELFLENGITPVITGRDKGKLSSASKSLGCESFLADMQKPGELRDLVDHVLSSHSMIDILVNSAGIGHFKPIEKLSDSEIEEMVFTNYLGLVQLTRLVVPVMKKQKSGSIINISSSAGLRVYPKGSVYCSTKFAVRGFSAALFEELKPHGIRVSTVYPGSTLTHFFDKNRFVTDKKSMIPAREIAKAILFCANAQGNADITEVMVKSMKR